MQRQPAQIMPQVSRTCSVVMSCCQALRMWTMRPVGCVHMNHAAIIPTPPAHRQPTANLYTEREIHG